MNKICNKIKHRKNANDVIYTPLPVAKIMIDMCDIKENETVLDPSKGGGVFYDNLPKCKKEYCEITENKDFFKWNKKVDLIIGNPPYSLWSSWIEHTLTLTDKFCYIFGLLNFTPQRLQDILDAGFKIKKFVLLKVDWWFGASFCILFDKNEKNDIFSTVKSRFLCDICNKRCKRGRKFKDKKYGMNECSNITENEKISK